MVSSSTNASSSGIQLGMNVEGYFGRPFSRVFHENATFSVFWEVFLQIILIHQSAHSISQQEDATIQSELPFQQTFKRIVRQPVPLLRLEAQTWRIPRSPACAKCCSTSWF